MKNKILVYSFGFIALTFSLSGSTFNEKSLDGIKFQCPAEKILKINSEMDNYLLSLGITPELYVKVRDLSRGSITFSLNTSKYDYSTLNLKDRPEYKIQDEKVQLVDLDQKSVMINTVSKKEIVLALMQHGRLTKFSGDACDLQALKDNVGIRQMIVAWTENLNWTFPEGDPAFWNEKYWKKGTPLKDVPLPVAFLDAFTNQKKYSVGCYTASKIVIVQGILDYFSRVNPNPRKLKIVIDRLMLDQDPLVSIEPHKMWSFETDFDKENIDVPGKMLKIQYGIKAGNFVPGDWTYFLNTNAETYTKTGYEGSNAIYLGRDRFDDYYNDNNHFYTYKEKIDEVFQWRNHVFSRSRDAAKIQPLSIQDITQLSLAPDEGGLVQDFRTSPFFFGYEDLPEFTNKQF